MSSNIRIQRICEYCKKDFIAKTTVTRFCGNDCAKRSYKARKRAEKIEKSNIETVKIISKPIEDVQAKEFLTVKEVSILIGCSIRTIYRLINNGTLKAVKLSERITRVKRTSIDEILN